MSSLLRKRFDAAKCKTLLQLTTQRLKVLRNKQALSLKKTRVDVAKLLEKGQDSNAKMQVEAVFREEKILTLYELLDQFCQLIINRLESMKSQKECPLDLKEAVASLIFAAPQCAELQELKQISKHLKSKYGADFSDAAKELRPDCGVNKQIVQSLSSRSPDLDAKLKMLKEIAAESNINWDSEKAMSDVSKGDSDFIDGPSHFASATELAGVGTSAIADKQKSMSMHVNEAKGQASTFSSASFDLPHQNVHRSANINTNTGATQKVPDSVIHTPVIDPYALARAQGKMDYKVVSDYLGSTQVSEGHLKSRDLKQENRGGVTYGQPTQSAERERGHNALLDASHLEDTLQRSKGKKAKKRCDVMDVHRRNEEDELLELKNVAESAFASATQAAMAARVAVDLVRMESLRRPRGSAPNIPQEMHSESSSGAVQVENHKVAGMDTKHSADRDTVFCEDEVEIKPTRNNVMVDDDHVSGTAGICSTLDASEDLFKYVVFEQASDLQKYAPSSTQSEGYDTNVGSYAFPTLYSRKNSDRIIFDAEPEEIGLKEVPTNALFDKIYSDIGMEQELDKKRNFKDNQERNFHQTEVQQNKYTQNDLSVPQFDDYSSEMDDYIHKDLPVPQFDDSSSSEEDDYMQKDLPAPQLDDHNSEDAGEEEKPFYLKGRLAMMAAEDYSIRTARTPYSKTHMLMPTASSSTDEEVEEESNTNMRKSQQEALGVSNDKEKLSFMENGSGQCNVDKSFQEQSFNGNVESVSLSTQSSKPPSRDHSSTDSMGESSLMSPVAYNHRSSKPTTPQKLKWPLSVFKEWDLDSSYDEMASPLASVKNRSPNGIGDPSIQVNRKLNWLSTTSEDSDSPSERSFQSHQQKWSPSSLEALQKPLLDTEDLTKPTQVTQPPTPKSYHGVSVRSVRSTQSRQKQDPPLTSDNKDIRR